MATCEGMGFSSMPGGCTDFRDIARWKMEKSLTRYIWANTYAQQIWILLVVFLSMIPYFLAFDLPKQIVNGPIQGEGFEHPTATQPFLELSFDMPLIGPVDLFGGFSLDRFQTLMGLSLVFLSLVVLNGLFKFYINTYKGRLGERMLRRIRFELFDRALRFPPLHFKRVKSPEIATMIKDEVEPLGGFIGDAFVQPALLGGQAITALVFILVQNIWLGLIATSMVGVQAAIIPRMRKRLLELGRERQLTARELSGRVAEVIDGIFTIRANDTSNLERADIAARLARIFSIRYDLYQWKFLVKFINNILAQLTPFLFYVVGGTLALQGTLDIGQLVAVIAAYKDLPGPIKELIDWDQARQDVQIKYQQVVEQFDVEPLVLPAVQALVSTHSPRLSEALVVSNLVLCDDSGARRLDRISLEIQPNETVAIIDHNGNAGEALAEAIGRIILPESGRITIAGKELHEIPEAVTGRQLSYVSSDTHFFQGTLRDNLLYGLKHAPLRDIEYTEAAARQNKWERKEAQLAGNPYLDLNSDWVDYQSAGATGPEDLYKVIGAVLDTVTITQDILDLALRSRVDTVTHKPLADRIVELRAEMRRRLQDEDLDAVVVPFEPQIYNSHATVVENLLFGSMKQPLMSPEQLSAHPYFRRVMIDTGAAGMLFEMGLSIAETAVELFSDLPEDHPFFQQLTFMTAADLPVYESLVQKLQGKTLEEASPADRSSIIRMSFSYIEPRHRFGLLTEDRMALLVRARETFHANIPKDLASVVERYDIEAFTASASLMDNILFGRIALEQDDTSKRIRAISHEIFDSLGLRNDVLSIGLDFEVGSQGRRLTVAQRQKLNMARVLLKRSDYFIFNKPLSALDRRSQDRIITNVMQMSQDDETSPSIIWVLSNPDAAQFFDRVLVFEGAASLDSGNFAELSEKNSIFKELLS